MKRIVVLVIAIVLLVGLVKVAGAENWYAITFLKERCAKLSEGSSGDWKTPADLIKGYQKLEIPYKVIDDEVENGKVVQVTIIDLSNYSGLTFYYGLERCNKALKARKTKQEKELEKYK